MSLPDLARVTGFQWDAGNARKNEKHRVAPEEAEQVFERRVFIFEDLKHSGSETRYRALGETDSGRQLQVVFTLRENGTLIRVISVRPMKRSERVTYEAEKAQAHPSFQN